MTSRVRATACALLPLLWLACTRPPSPPPPGVLTVSVEQTASWIRNFNPLVAGGARWPTASGVYEPLFIYNTVRGE